MMDRALLRGTLTQLMQEHAICADNRTSCEKDCCVRCEVDNIIDLFTQTYREMLLDEITTTAANLSELNKSKMLSGSFNAHLHNRNVPGWNAYHQEMLKIIEEVEK